MTDSFDSDEAFSLSDQPVFLIDGAKSPKISIEFDEALRLPKQPVEAPTDSFDSGEAFSLSDQPVFVSDGAKSPKDPFDSGEAFSLSDQPVSLSDGAKSPKDPFDSDGAFSLSDQPVFLSDGAKSPKNLFASVEDCGLPDPPVSPTDDAQSPKGSPSGFAEPLNIQLTTNVELVEAVDVDPALLLKEVPLISVGSVNVSIEQPLVELVENDQTSGQLFHLVSLTNDPIVKGIGRDLNKSPLFEFVGDERESLIDSGLQLFDSGPLTNYPIVEGIGKGSNESLPFDFDESEPKSVQLMDSVLLTNNPIAESSKTVVSESSLFDFGGNEPKNVQLIDSVFLSNKPIGESNDKDPELSSPLDSVKTQLVTEQPIDSDGLTDEEKADRSARDFIESSLLNSLGNVPAAEKPINSSLLTDAPKRENTGLYLFESSLVNFVGKQTATEQPIDTSLLISQPNCESNCQDFNDTPFLNLIKNVPVTEQLIDDDILNNQSLGESIGQENIESSLVNLVENQPESHKPIDCKNLTDPIVGQNNSQINIGSSFVTLAESEPASKQLIDSKILHNETVLNFIENVPVAEQPISSDILTDPIIGKSNIQENIVSSILNFAESEPASKQSIESDLLANETIAGKDDQSCIESFLLKVIENVTTAEQQFKCSILTDQPIGEKNDQISNESPSLDLFEIKPTAQQPIDSDILINSPIGDSSGQDFLANLVKNLPITRHSIDSGLLTEQPIGDSSGQESIESPQLNFIENVSTSEQPIASDLLINQPMVISKCQDSIESTLNFINNQSSAEQPIDSCLLTDQLVVKSNGQVSIESSLANPIENQTAIEKPIESDLLINQPMVSNNCQDSIESTLNLLNNQSPTEQPINSGLLIDQSIAESSGQDFIESSLANPLENQTATEKPIESDLLIKQPNGKSSGQESTEHSLLNLIEKQPAAEQPSDFDILANLPFGVSSDKSFTASPLVDIGGNGPNDNDNVELSFLDLDLNENAPQKTIYSDFSADLQLAIQNDCSAKPDANVFSSTSQPRDVAHVIQANLAYDTNTDKEFNKSSNDLVGDEQTTESQNIADIDENTNWSSLISSALERNSAVNQLSDKADADDCQNCDDPFAHDLTESEQLVSGISNAGPSDKPQNDKKGSESPSESLQAVSPLPSGQLLDTSLAKNVENQAGLSHEEMIEYYVSLVQGQNDQRQASDAQKNQQNEPLKSDDGPSQYNQLPAFQPDVPFNLDSYQGERQVGSQVGGNLPVVQQIGEQQSFDFPEEGNDRFQDTSEFRKEEKPPRKKIRPKKLMAKLQSTITTMHSNRDLPSNNCAQAFLGGNASLSPFICVSAKQFSSRAPIVKYKVPSDNLENLTSKKKLLSSRGDAPTEFASSKCFSIKNSMMTLNFRSKKKVNATEKVKMPERVAPKEKKCKPAKKSAVPWNFGNNKKVDPMLSVKLTKVQPTDLTKEKNESPRKSSAAKKTLIPWNRGNVTKKEKPPRITKTKVQIADLKEKKVELQKKVELPKQSLDAEIAPNPENSENEMKEVVSPCITKAKPKNDRSDFKYTFKPGGTFWPQNEVVSAGKTAVANSRRLPQDPAPAKKTKSDILAEITLAAEMKVQSWLESTKAAIESGKADAETQDKLTPENTTINRAEKYFQKAGNSKEFDLLCSEFILHPEVNKPGPVEQTDDHGVELGECEASLQVAEAKAAEPIRRELKSHLCATASNDDKPESSSNDEDVSEDAVDDKTPAAAEEPSPGVFCPSESVLEKKSSTGDAKKRLDGTQLRSSKSVLRTKASPNVCDKKQGKVPLKSKLNAKTEVIDELEAEASVAQENGEEAELSSDVSESESGCSNESASGDDAELDKQTAKVAQDQTHQGENSLKAGNSPKTGNSLKAVKDKSKDKLSACKPKNSGGKNQTCDGLGKAGPKPGDKKSAVSLNLQSKKKARTPFWRKSTLLNLKEDTKKTETPGKKVPWNFGIRNKVDKLLAERLKVLPNPDADDENVDSPRKTAGMIPWKYGKADKTESPRLEKTNSSSKAKNGSDQKVKPETSKSNLEANVMDSERRSNDPGEEDSKSVSSDVEIDDALSEMSFAEFAMLPDFNVFQAVGRLRAESSKHCKQSKSNALPKPMYSGAPALGSSQPRNLSDIDSITGDSVNGPMTKADDSKDAETDCDFESLQQSGDCTSDGDLADVESETDKNGQKPTRKRRSVLKRASKLKKQVSDSDEESSDVAEEIDAPKSPAHLKSLLDCEVKPKRSPDGPTHKAKEQAELISQLSSEETDLESDCCAYTPRGEKSGYPDAKKDNTPYGEESGSPDAEKDKSNLKAELSEQASSSSIKLNPKSKSENQASFDFAAVESQLVASQPEITTSLKQRMRSDVMKVGGIPLSQRSTKRHPYNKPSTLLKFGRGKMFDSPPLRKAKPPDLIEKENTEKPAQEPTLELAAMNDRKIDSPRKSSADEKQTIPFKYGKMIKVTSSLPVMPNSPKKAKASSQSAKGKDAKRETQNHREMHALLSNNSSSHDEADMGDSVTKSMQCDSPQPRGFRESEGELSAGDVTSHSDDDVFDVTCDVVEPEVVPTVEPSVDHSKEEQPSIGKEAILDEVPVEQAAALLNLDSILQVKTPFGLDGVLNVGADAVAPRDKPLHKASLSVEDPQPGEPDSAGLDSETVLNGETLFGIDDFSKVGVERAEPQDGPIHEAPRLEDSKLVAPTANGLDSESALNGETLLGIDDFSKVGVDEVEPQGDPIHDVSRLVTDPELVGPNAAASNSESSLEVKVTCGIDDTSRVGADVAELRAGPIRESSQTVEHLQLAESNGAELKTGLLSNGETLLGRDDVSNAGVDGVDLRVDPIQDRLQPVDGARSPETSSAEPTSDFNSNAQAPLCNDVTSNSGVDLRLDPIRDRLQPVDGARSPETSSAEPTSDFNSNAQAPHGNDATSCPLANIAQISEARPATPGLPQIMTNPHPTAGLNGDQSLQESELPIQRSARPATSLCNDDTSNSGVDGVDLRLDPIQDRLQPVDGARSPETSSAEPTSDFNSNAQALHDNDATSCPLANIAQISEARPATPGQRPATPGPRPATPGQRPATPGPRPATPGPRPATPGPRPATPGMTNPHPTAGLNGDQSLQESELPIQRSAGFDELSCGEATPDNPEAIALPDQNEIFDNQESADSAFKRLNMSNMFRKVRFEGNLLSVMGSEAGVPTLLNSNLTFGTRELLLHRLGIEDCYEKEVKKTLKKKGPPKGNLRIKFCEKVKKCLFQHESSIEDIHINEIVEECDCYLEDKVPAKWQTAELERCKLLDQSGQEDEVDDDDEAEARRLWLEDYDGEVDEYDENNEYDEYHENNEYDEYDENNEYDEDDEYEDPCDAEYREALQAALLEEQRRNQYDDNNNDVTKFAPQLQQCEQQEKSPLSNDVTAVTAEESKHDDVKDVNGDDGFKADSVISECHVNCDAMSTQPEPEVSSSPFEISKEVRESLKLNLEDIVSEGEASDEDRNAAGCTRVFFPAFAAWPEDSTKSPKGQDGNGADDAEKGLQDRPSSSKSNKLRKLHTNLACRVYPTKLISSRSQPSVRPQSRGNVSETDVTSLRNCASCSYVRRASGRTEVGALASGLPNRANVAALGEGNVATSTPDNTTNKVAILINHLCRKRRRHLNKVAPLLSHARIIQVIPTCDTQQGTEEVPENAGLPVQRRLLNWARATRQSLKTFFCRLRPQRR